MIGRLTQIWKYVYLPRMVLKKITCSNITEIWLYIQVWIQKQKDDFVYTLRSALLVPLYFHFAGSRAGLLMPIILYVYIYIYFLMVVGYGGVGFAQGPASLRRSMLWLGLCSALFWCRICDYRDAGSPSYPLIMCWRCRDLNFRSMLWYGACLEVAIVPVRCYSLDILKSLQAPSLTP